MNIFLLKIFSPFGKMTLTLYLDSVPSDKHLRYIIWFHNLLLLPIVLVTQLCLTPCDPTDCSPPVSSVHGILQARMLEWVAIPSLLPIARYICQWHTSQLGWQERMLLLKVEENRVSFFYTGGLPSVRFRGLSGGLKTLWDHFIINTVAYCRNRTWKRSRMDPAAEQWVPSWGMGREHFLLRRSFHYLRGFRKLTSNPVFCYLYMTLKCCISVELQGFWKWIQLTRWIGLYQDGWQIHIPAHHVMCINLACQLKSFRSGGKSVKDILLLVNLV